MLETHLSADQIRALAQVRSAASGTGLNVFLTGGTLRDMLAGFPILEIDFTVEGNALKLAKAITAKGGTEMIAPEDPGKSIHLILPGGVRATVGMARQEKYAKPGSKPHVQQSTIHEDLRGRDFTINSIALSLNEASRGLLLDPNNGVGDIANKELRAVGSYTLYDDPVRLLRLQRFKVRLGFTVSERTLAQYANVRATGLETRIPPAALLEELRRIAAEPNVADVVRVLDEEKLLTLFSPALTASKLNMASLLKLQKAVQIVPHGAGLNFNYFAPFLSVLTEKFSPAERSTFVQTLGIGQDDVEQWQKLDARSKKLEKELKAPKLQKPSNLYKLLFKAPGDQILILLVRSTDRLVQDRIKNYLQKYLPAAQEVSEADVAASGLQPGTPKYEKARIDLISAKLDARPKKIPPPPPEEPPPPPPTHGFVKRQHS